MSKKGKMSDTPKNKTTLDKIRDSYLYRIIKKLLSMICTLLLIFFLVIGAMMFYFNMQAKSAEEQGLSYNAPFGLYTIISGSMEPNIHVYDVVAVMDVQDMSKIKVGDVITFISSWDLNYGSTVTHRVVSVSKTDTGEIQLATKGDNNQSADGAVVTKENLVGKVFLRIPQLGRLQFFLATKMGWFIVVFIPAMGVIIMDIIKIVRLRVLKNDIGNIVDTDNADKVYFGNERLDNMDIEEGRLNKTTIISREELEEELEKEIKNKDNSDYYEDDSKDEMLDDDNFMDDETLIELKEEKNPKKQSNKKRQPLKKRNNENNNSKNE